MTPDELKKSRNGLGWSQERLGEALGVEARTVRRWEAGQTRIPKAAQMAVELYAERRLNGTQEQGRD